MYILVVKPMVMVINYHNLIKQCSFFLSISVIMHHIGRSVGLDCDCSDIHVCETLVFGAGNEQITFAEIHIFLTGH